MKRHTVLIIVGDRAQREEMERVLSLDFEVLSTEGPAEAIPLLQTRRPSVVVVSYAQEGSNGLRLCNYLRTRRGGIRPIMIVLGPTGQPIRSRAALQEKWRVDLVVPHAIEPGLLLAILWEALSQANARRQAALAAEEGEPPPWMAASRRGDTNGKGIAAPTQPQGTGAAGTLTPINLPSKWSFSRPPLRSSAPSERDYSRLNWLELLETPVSRAVFREIFRRLCAPVSPASGAAQPSM